MEKSMEQRARELAEYLIESRGTVRSAAARFGVSKSTVHKDVTQRLRSLDRLLYEDVRVVLELNKAERHIRGGLATKRKYRSDQRQRREAEG